MDIVPMGLSKQTEIRVTVYHICVLTGTSSALQHSQHEQRRVRFLQSQTNIRYKIQDERSEVHWSPSDHICHIAYHSWGNSRYNHIRSDGEIDQSDCNAQVQGDGMDSGIIDETAQRGKHAREGDEENDPSFLARGEIRVFGFVRSFCIAFLRPSLMVRFTHDGVCRQSSMVKIEAFEVEDALSDGEKSSKRQE